MTEHAEREPAAAEPDLSEKGRTAEGRQIRSDRRLYMQLHVFTNASGTYPVTEAMDMADLPGVVYESVTDPHGLAVLSFADDPAFFLDRLKPLLTSGVFKNLTPRPEFTMFGRTYSLGYEPDLNEALIARPLRHVTNPDWPWAIWYPLRRHGAFEQLDAQTQREILMEHGRIGRQFAEQDLAHDIRLACHGLDAHDNDFVIGITGHELHPLSALIQRMRMTQQTSQYLARLGPFFVGRAVWRQGW